MLSLLSTRGAIPFYLAILFNAIIDLGHKITIQNTIFKVHNGSEQIVLTAIVNALIILPYVLLFFPIGFVANKTPKPRIMRLTAWVSVFLVGLLWFFYQSGWFWFAFATTFLMSIQSAFYSPAKLGYLKVLFGVDRVTAANGLAQSVVIVGILVGTLLFSLGFEHIYAQVFLQSAQAVLQDGQAVLQNAQAALQDAQAAQTSSLNAVANLVNKSSVLSSMHVLVYVLMLFALLQLVLVYRIPLIDETVNADDSVAPIAAVNTKTKTIDAWKKLVMNRHFLVPILGLALFWSLGQGVLAIFPAFAKAHANITNTAVIQGILTCTGLGIVFGAGLVERFTRQAKAGKPVNVAIAPIGIALMAVGLFSITLFQSPWFFAANYFVLGVASGLLIVPLNAYIQLRASSHNIGSVIATSNLFQNTAILLMLGATIAVALWGLNARYMLLAIAVLAAVVGVVLVPMILRLR